MMKIKVMSIFGTRPEATKMCPLIKVLEQSEHIDSLVCVTAQHREMLDSVLDVFGVTPNFDLNIMQSGQTLTEITVRALTGIEKLLAEARPDLILVHGDTSTTFVGSLAAFYHKVKVGHVEAGLRTYDKYQPFPEEINRKMTTALADLNFAPTALAKECLLKENVDPSSIFVTGNTAIDCIKNSIKPGYRFDKEPLNSIDYLSKRIIVMTAHRAENIGEPFEQIFGAIKKVVTDCPDIELVYPVHLNPKVREQAWRILSGEPRIHLIDPLNMTDMHNLMNKAYIILTDSGGLQEEALAISKPVIVLRNLTERPEGLTAGMLKLGGTEFASVYNETMSLLNDKLEYKRMSEARNPYGDGFASERILDAILYHYRISEQRPDEWNA